MGERHKTDSIWPENGLRIWPGDEMGEKEKDLQ